MCNPRRRIEDTGRDGQLINEWVVARHLFRTIGGFRLGRLGTRARLRIAGASIMLKLWKQASQVRLLECMATIWRCSEGGGKAG